MKSQQLTDTSDLGSLTDAELMERGRAEIRSHASHIAKITGLRTAAVEHGLYGFHWPSKSLSANELCDVLMDASIVLHSLRLGMTLEVATGCMTAARNVRAREFAGADGRSA
jgi:hypothetical protein